METKTLKAIIYDSRFDLIQKVNSEWFSDIVNKNVFNACVKCLYEKKELNVEALKTYIYSNGNTENMKALMYNRIENIYDEFPPENIIQCFEDYYKNKKITELSNYLINKDSTLDTRYKKLLDIYLELTQKSVIKDVANCGKDLNDYIKNIIEGQTSYFKQRSIELNSELLKYLFDYYIRPWPIIIASRPGMHKTSFLINIINELLDLDKTGLYFSFEDSKETLQIKILAQKFDWPFHKIDNITKEQMKDIKLNFNKYENLFYTDRRYNIINFRQEIDKQFSIKKHDFIVIDYLQLFLMEKGSKRHEQLDLITQEFISICHDYTVPIICLSQVNDRDESRDEINLHLGNLAGSSAIEQNARQVLIINGKRSESNRHIKVVKNTGAGLKEASVNFSESGLISNWGTNE